MGQHYHDFMSGYAAGVEYNACDGVGIYAKFANFENVTKSYFAWFDHWEHYGSWRLKAREGGLQFLKHIGPHYCPPGFTEAWKKAHGGLDYADYIGTNLLGEAKSLLSSYDKPDSEAETITKIVLNRKDDGTPVATAYAGDTPRWTHIVQANSFEDFKTWCGQFPNAKLIGIEDTTKAFPKLPDYGVVDPLPPEKPKPDGKLPLTIPFAKQYACGMKVQGKYPKKFPEGLIVHFTAGRGKAEDMLDYCVSKGYTLAAIDKAGNIVQSATLDSWGYHCGTFHQETHIGIEIVNAGRLTKKADGTFWSWFDTEIPKENVRFMAGTAEQIEGYYEKYTEAQEAALVKLCLWLRDVGLGIFKIDNVIGHDEACCRSSRGRGAKNDPGAALSMSMPKFREFLKSK
jgi:hypothetical protein